MPSLGDEYRFRFNEGVGKESGDLLAAAWCISLWVDAEAKRREIVKSTEKSKGLLRRLAGLWQSEEVGANSSKPKSNKLHEKLGLGEPTILEPPREVMWYEHGENSESSQDPAPWLAANEDT